MHPAIATIRFGPFASPYHREAVGDDFKERLSAFLEAKLMPQVEQPYESTSGVLTAAYDDQKYCGPRSAIRDIYKFEFIFHRSSDEDTIKVQLIFDPATRVFSTRYGRPICLWTMSRRLRQAQERQVIDLMCRRIANHEQVAAICPVCAAPLHVVDSPGLFDVSCSTRCFSYNYHRDPVTGEFLHGHFLQKEMA